jgi:uncharacterized cupredoxin-like copper-binding protein
MTRALASRLLALLLVFGGLAFQAPVAHAADADPFTIAPTTLTFPATAVGETSAGIAVTVTNAWGISQTLTTVAGGVPFDAANFSTVQNCAGVTLAPGASCAFTYTFTPTTTGPLTTTTNFSINGQPSGTITLNGTGTPAFTISPTTITFPTTVVGDTSAGIDVTITNTSGVNQTLTAVAGGSPFDSVNFTGVQNCVSVTLAPGASCAFTYKFTPTTMGPLTTTTNFSINGQGSGTITLNGTGTPAFTIAPTTLNFPATAVGDTSAGMDVTITNATSSNRTLTAVAGGAPFDSANFTGVQNCVSVTLAPGASCAFTYKFTPTTLGPLTTTTNFSINGQASGTITLNGTGIPAFTIAPATVNFPATAVGDSSAGIDVTITNASGANQTLTAVAGGAPFDSANFTGVQNCVGVTLAPGASCAFTYTFTPTTTGPLTTTTNFSINGQASGTITLTGTGMAFRITPTALNFPDTNVGATAPPMSLTVTNVLSSSQTLSVVGGAPADPTHFGGAQDCAGATLAPGASCAFTYTFAPTSAGLHTTTANFTITSEAVVAAAAAGRSVAMAPVAIPLVTQGSGVITLSGTGISLTTTTTSTTTGPTTTTPTPTPSSTPLATTGSEVGFPLGLALVLMLAGAGLVRLARRTHR